MKTRTFLTRRVDALGRIVLPREIRRNLRIREGDPLEIYTDREGIIFQKFSPVGELAPIAGEYAETLHKVCSLSVLICDKDTVVAAAGVSKKEFVDKPLSEELEAIMEDRSLYLHREGGSALFPVKENTTLPSRCAMPIITEGDVVGCVVSLGDADRAGRESAEVESKLIQTAATFLGKQLEA